MTIIYNEIYQMFKNKGIIMRDIKNKNILIVSHCILNGHSKVESFCEKKEREEARKKIVKFIIENDIGIIQLPCPELIMYGTRRWGHVKDQFDTPHFREVCRNQLKTYLQQIKEYINNGYKILGILGIDGSPSCGVDLTCKGQWGGEIGSNPNLLETIKGIRYEKEKGILMEEIEDILKENDIKIEMFGFSLQNADSICKKIDQCIYQVNVE